MPQPNLRSFRHTITRAITGRVVPAVALSLMAAPVYGQGLPPAVSSGQAAAAGGGSGYFTDPATGIVYRKVQRTVERPVVETHMQAQQSTYYRPETVVEVRPETRTVYTPVVSYGWEPRMRGRWNPFVQPTIQYEHTPRTHWEARSETVERREARTNWVAEHRSVDVPQQIVKIQREEKEYLEAVGRVAPPMATPPNSAEAAIAARLRPLDGSTAVAPISSITTLAPVGDATRRSNDQLGLRATELHPGYSGGYSVPLPPPSAGIAITPYVPIWR
jgi:hypothetical protein